LIKIKDSNIQKLLIAYAQRK